MWMFIVLPIIGCAAFFRSLYERRTLSVSRYELKTDKIKADRTFVFLSDLHNNCFGERQEKLLDAIEKEKPDAILIGGDMMVVKDKADTGAALFLIKELSRRYPVFYGNGNHENRMEQNRGKYGDQYDRYIRELGNMGVIHLPDSSASFGEYIRISGLNIEDSYYKKFKTSPMEVRYIENRIGKADPEYYQILLAHSPMFHETCARWGADLVLCGHFHGGTVRIPGLGGLMTPQFQFFRKCCGGIHWLSGKAMIVSRGLGTHSVNIRLNNKPDLVVIRIKAAVYRT